MDSPYFTESQCSICKTAFDSEFEALFTFTERPEWHDRKKSALCSIESFRKMNFRTTWLWSSFVRCIIDNSSREDKGWEPGFHLSGIAQLGFWQDDWGPTFITVPLDPDVAFVGRPPPKNREEVIPVFAVASHKYKDLDPRVLGPLAFQVHARCWDIAVSVFGSARLEENLGTFVDAARSQAKTKLTKSKMPESDWQIYHNIYKEFRRRGGGNLEYFRFHPEEYVRKRRAEEWEKKSSFQYLAYDPLNIKELGDLIAEVKGSGTSDYCEEVDIGVYLSTDIRMTIVDAIDPGDIPSFFAAFNWKLPDTYWKTRLDKDLIFEFDVLKNVDLDWQYLFLGVQELLKTSHGLRLRKRAINNLHHIKRVFNEILEEEDESFDESE